MKIALVCDDLIQFGGQERLVLALTELYPDAPLYTTAASQEWVDLCATKGIDLRTSFMQKLPKIEKLNRYYSLFLFHILGLESFDFTGYDVVISVSSRFAHGIITKPSTKHICYMNSPGRMIWEPQSYFEHEKYGFLRPFKFLARFFISPFLSSMRNWDYAAAQRVDYFIANSQTPRERIRKYYGRESVVVYPFFDEKSNNKNNLKGAAKDDSYYLLISRLQPWKRADVAVKCCSGHNINLKVIGTGSHIDELRKMAGSSVGFCGYVSEEEKERLINNCTALIQTQFEDFGIVPLEILSRGKPVIAYGRGGVTEIVQPGITGEFFLEQTSEALYEVLNQFDPQKYKSKDCISSTQKFTKDKFMRGIQEFVSSVYLNARLS